MAGRPPPPPPPPPPPGPGACSSVCCNCPGLAVGANTTISTPSNSVAAQAKALWDGLFTSLWGGYAAEATSAGVAFYTSFNQWSGESIASRAATTAAERQVKDWIAVATLLKTTDVFCVVPGMLPNDPEHDKGNGCLCDSGLAEYNAAKHFWPVVSEKIVGVKGWLLTAGCLDSKTWPSFDISKPKKCPKTIQVKGCTVTGCWIPNRTKSIQTLTKAIDCLTVISNKMQVGITFHASDKTQLNKTPSWAAEKGARMHQNWQALPGGASLCFSLVKLAKEFVRDEMNEKIEDFKSLDQTTILEGMVNSFATQYKAQIKQFVSQIKAQCIAGCGTGASCKGSPCSFIQGDMETYTAQDIWNLIHNAVGAYGTPFPSTINDIIGYSSKFWTKATVVQLTKAVEDVIKSVYENCLTTEQQVKNFIDALKSFLETMKSKYQGLDQKCECTSWSKSVGNEQSESVPCPNDPTQKCYHGNKPIIGQLTTTIICPFKGCNWSVNISGEDSAGSSYTTKSYTMFANDIAGHAILYCNSTKCTPLDPGDA